jgi:hypothetical protein
MCVYINEHEGCHHGSETPVQCGNGNCTRRMGNPNNPLPRGTCPFCVLPSPPTTSSSGSSTGSSRSSRSTVSNVSRSSRSSGGSSRSR